jgi:hypothetical protein
MEHAAFTLLMLVCCNVSYDISVLHCVLSCQDAAFAPLVLTYCHVAMGQEDAAFALMMLMCCTVSYDVNCCHVVMGQEEARLSQRRLKALETELEASKGGDTIISELQQQVRQKQKRHSWKEGSRKEYGESEKQSRTVRH